MRNYNGTYSYYNEIPYRQTSHEHNYSNGQQHQSSNRRNYNRRASPNEQNWRNSNDYRKEYFDKNRGIGGVLYICSQCFTPMLNRSKIQADHIIPPSRFVNRVETRNGTKNTNMLSRMLNHSFNIVAICSKCNLKKSNKMGLVTLKGITAKLIEVTAHIVQYGLVLSLALALLIAPLPFKLLRLLCNKNNSDNRRRYSY